jgi:hypothetical protein
MKGLPSIEHAYVIAGGANELSAINALPLLAEHVDARTI